ncbi:DddA-like double-stranded DNA deaminase toxin [Stackebrandtia nassauensis]|uniref:Uncharacterized protein n=1 Tax=Stackebrandtia nassauensis (strain DSM 44728 / CIP 108903 / NRRL B-16338 / NBRC 102104 / LLR-40K-21) TaxID=446470 RepID=D3Q0G1_STANL|nr:DddA-like double-stranded DNA deaminase toxin [Stackebrandtia nassauensis]ADD41697.1 hypothetical protein Snas_2001 [Stackebrandtia nassauensis DSM 44728]
MGSIEELTAAVRAALSTIAEGKTLTDKSRAALVDGTAALTGISRGSTSYRLRTMLEALTAAIQATERAEDVEAAVLDAMDAYLSEIAGGNAPARAGPKAPEPKQPGGSSSPRARDGRIDFRALLERLKAQGVVGLEGRSDDPIPDFDPKKQNPACYQGLAPRQKGKPVRGNLFFPDGRRWNDVALESSRGEPAFDLNIIKPEYRSLSPARGHLEGNVAAWMRSTFHQEMVLYINESPCRKHGKGCLYTLEHFLPRGYVLHVWSRNDRGEWRGNTFRGSGEAFTEGA